MTASISRSIGDVMAEIKMCISNFSGSFLLVEGTSDSRFVGKRIAKSHCEIIICGAKSVVIETTKRANGGIAKALGLVDNDFDTTLGIQYSTDDVVSTDTHDIETLLLSSPALDRVVEEYANADRVQQLLAKEGTDLRNALIKRAAPFGRYRLINEIHRFNVSFADGFSPWKYIGTANWALDDARLEADFAAAAQVDLPRLRGLVQQLPTASPWNIVQGHDAIAILSIAFRSVLGANPCLSGDTLCSALRLAFDDLVFKSTRLHAKISAWEARNGAKVLSI